jgi:predicted unusual protein kinase regulating ubiquinone biosynthesis (AarF/ABC1/UbiB family)
MTPLQTLILCSTALALLALLAALRWRRRGALRLRGLSTSASGRAARVGGLLTRSAFRRLVLRLRQLVADKRRRRELADQVHLREASEAAELMGNMKGVAMKLGQILSFADESLPEPAREALRGLQQDAPPMAFDLVRQTIEAEFSRPLPKLLASIDEEPLAAASIGQVHRARLLDGRQVVLKVQYPGVEQAIEADLKLSNNLAGMIGMFMPNAEAKPIAAELSERLREELDYERELRNQQLFFELWKGHPLIRVPRVYPELSSRRVLCQEYCRGLRFYDFVEQASADEKALAVFVLNDFVFDSMHRHHVFNGDPHPGNYLFHEDGGVSFLDFGCIKYFEPGFMGQVQAFNRAIVEEDRDAFDLMVKEMGVILPDRPYDRDFVWEFFRYHAAPFADDVEFAFTKDYVAKAREVMSLKNVRRLNLPPSLLLFNRITFGLNAIFAELGAKANFYQLYRRYLYPHEQVGPALAQLGAELPQRFLETGAEPARLLAA